MGMCVEVRFGGGHPSGLVSVVGDRYPPRVWVLIIVMV